MARGFRSIIFPHRTDEKALFAPFAAFFFLMLLRRNGRSSFLNDWADAYRSRNFPLRLRLFGGFSLGLSARQSHFGVPAFPPQSQQNRELPLRRFPMARDDFRLPVASRDMSPVRFCGMFPPFSPASKISPPPSMCERALGIRAPFLLYRKKSFRPCSSTTGPRKFPSPDNGSGTAPLLSRAGISHPGFSPSRKSPTLLPRVLLNRELFPDIFSPRSAWTSLFGRPAVIMSI